MITIQSLLKVANDLIPVEEFVGPVVDENYIEGAIVLSVGNKPMLTREMVDYIDQLWAYLIEGLEEVVAGREFSTYYPDMPLEIVLRPDGDHVTIKVDPREKGPEVTVAIDELCNAMASAGTLFFERLRPFVARGDMCDRYIARLAVLAASNSEQHAVPR